jgi:hypothetical protein
MGLFAVVTLLCAIGPVVWLARARIDSSRELVAAAAAASTMSGCALLAGPWVLSSVHLRPVILVALLAVLIRTAFRIRSGAIERGSHARARHLTGHYLTALVFGVLLADAVAGRTVPAGAVDLTFPLEADGEYAVLQGGNSVLLNPFHQWFVSDEHAVDLVKLEALGNRARGLAPRSLLDYATFDVAVRGPCAGTVERLVDGVPDHPPGEMDWQHPPGNHIVIRCGSVRVLLAHLRQGSIVVAANGTVRAGQLVARIGNSGGTREPHLHIGAMDAEGVESFPTARAVPVTFEGRYLRINDIVDPTRRR